MASSFSRSLMIRASGGGLLCRLMALPTKALPPPSAGRVAQPRRRVKARRCWVVGVGLGSRGVFAFLTFSPLLIPRPARSKVIFTSLLFHLHCCLRRFTSPDPPTHKREGVGHRWCANESVPSRGRAAASQSTSFFQSARERRNLAMGAAAIGGALLLVAAILLALLRPWADLPSSPGRLTASPGEKGRPCVCCESPASSTPLWHSLLTLRPRYALCPFRAGLPAELPAGRFRVQWDGEQRQLRVLHRDAGEVRPVGVWGGPTTLPNS